MGLNIFPFENFPVFAFSLTCYTWLNESSDSPWVSPFGLYRNYAAFLHSSLSRCLILFGTYSLLVYILSFTAFVESLYVSLE